MAITWPWHVTPAEDGILMWWAAEWLWFYLDDNLVRRWAVPNHEQLGKALGMNLPFTETMSVGIESPALQALQRQYVPLQRFGFLVLVFSGLAYVTDPNAHASTKRVAWATLPHPPIILTAYQLIIAYPQSYPVFLVYQIVLAYLLYLFSLNMFERVFGFPQTCAVAVEAVVGRIAILVILVVSCLVLGDALGMRHVGRFNC